MTAEVLVRDRSAAPNRPAIVPWVLAPKEAKRLLRSPGMLVAAAVLFVPLGVDAVFNDFRNVWSKTAFYDLFVYITVLWFGLLAYVAAHLVTTSARRTGAEATLAALPVQQRGRGVGLCLGVILGPGAISLAVVTVLAWLGIDMPAQVAGNEAAWSLAELGQIPLVVVGGGLFGVVVATWLRFPGSLPVGLVFLVMTTLYLADEEHRAAVHWFMPFPTASDFHDMAWTATGSHAWHAAYLAGLCALGVCAVALRERSGRRPWILAGVGALLVTAVAGWAQV